MLTIRTIEGSRRTSTLDAPKGPLSIDGVSREGIRLSLVIPTYNEANNLEEMVRRLTAVLDPVLGSAYELIVVDDDSPDSTWTLAFRLAEQYPALRVMRRRGEKGLSTAVIRGWQVARGEVLAVIDADLQHPPEIVEKLWREIDGGADLAVGSRHVEGGGVSDWSPARRALSRGAQLLGVFVLPSVVGRVTDPMSGYFMVRRSAIARETMSPVGYKILIEVLGRGRIGRIAEVGYVFRERTAGESKVTWKLYVEYLRHLARLRAATLPARFPKFAAVGLSGVLVDMGALYLLSDPHALGLGLTRSKAMAAELAIMNNFLWNDAWTFGDVARKQGNGAARLRRFFKFNAICAMGLVLSVLLLNLQVGGLGMNRYVANGVAIGLVTMWNFWMNKTFSWASSPRVSAPERPQLPSPARRRATAQ